MTTIRATPIASTGIVPAWKPAPACSWRFIDEPRIVRVKQKATNILPPRPPVEVNRSASSGMCMAPLDGPITTADLYRRTMRVLGVDVDTIEGARRGVICVEGTWWRGVTCISELRMLIWAVLRSHPGRGVCSPSYPELCNLNLTSRRRNHSSIITALRKWSCRDSCIERAAELARRCGLGEAGAERVRALAERIRQDSAARVQKSQYTNETPN